MKLITTFLITSILLSCQSFDEIKLRDRIEILETQLINCNSLNEDEVEMTELENPEEQIVENMGIWKVDYYVDDFNEPTKDGYIRNEQYITGTFSNTATQNSKLNVVFLIPAANKVTFMLYEYAGRNPVKEYRSTPYRVMMQDAQGNRERLEAKNWSDRFVFGPSHSKKVHDALLKGGELKFKIIDVDTPTTEYGFTIANAGGYDIANNTLNKKDL